MAKAVCQRYRFATVVTSNSAHRHGGNHEVSAENTGRTRIKKACTRQALVMPGEGSDQLPATIIFSISTEPVRMLLRISRSLPTATICLNMSFMLPAMVTS